MAACLICGATDESCSHGTDLTGRPVAMPVEVTEHVPGKLVLIDRGDGHRFKVHERSVREFQSRHPTAFLVPPGSEGPAGVPDPAELQQPSLSDMTNRELIALAAERGVAVPKGPKAAIIAALEE